MLVQASQANLPVNPPTSVNKNHIPSANFVAADPSQLTVGMRVEHQKFGYGVIKEIEGSAHNPIAMIVFEANGEKKIMLNYCQAFDIGKLRPTRQVEGVPSRSI